MFLKFQFGFRKAETAYSNCQDTLVGIHKFPFMNQFCLAFSYLTRFLIKEIIISLATQTIQLLT